MNNEKTWRQSKGICLCQSLKDQQECLKFAPHRQDGHCWCAFIDGNDGIGCLAVLKEGKA